MRRNFIAAVDYASPIDVNRPRAPADVAQALSDRARGDFLRLSCSVERVVPVRQVRGERGRVRAAGAVRGAALVALARDLLEPVAVEEDVGRLLVAVTAGDDHGLRAERVDRPRELSGSASRRAGEHLASARFGVVTSASGKQRVAQRVPCVVGQQGRAALGDHHRVEHDGRVPHEPERLDDRLDRRDVAEHPDLHGVDADVLGHLAHLLDDHRRAAPDGRRSRRPCSAR